MRIGIVNAGARETELLRHAVALRPEHQVVWTGTTGADAVARCAQETPDLILMDLLTGMEGVDATRRIMTNAPCAILIVTGSVQRNTRRVFEAMGRGALDVVEMPAPGAGRLQDHAAPLLAKMATIARLLGDRETAPHAPAARGRSSRQPLQHPLIAIGASAGGPTALAAVLRGLPTDFPAAIVIVQHVEAQFAGGMAEWLSQQSGVPVRVAKEEERLAAGRALLAGTSDHLALKANHRLGYTAEPRDYVYRPSIDVFLASVCRLWPGDAVGVLLTGMGRDGALGLKALRNRGHYTIAQDEATSAVYGMPKAAAALHAAVAILPVGRIAARLVDVVAGRG